MPTERDIQVWQLPHYVKVALGKYVRMTKIRDGMYRVYPEGYTGITAFCVCAPTAKAARRLVKQYVVNNSDITDGRIIPKKV